METKFEKYSKHSGKLMWEGAVYLAGGYASVSTKDRYPAPSVILLHNQRRRKIMTKGGQSKKRTMNGFVIMYISIELKVLEIFIRPQKSWY